MLRNVSYGNYRIEANRVPDVQFDEADVGFGWGFKIFQNDTKSPAYKLVIKTMKHHSTDANVETAYNQGLRLVKKLIDNNGFEEDYICYWWDPEKGLMQGNCEDISPGGFKSTI